MAVITKDDALPRIKQLALEMDWDERLAEGTVAALWRNSQAGAVDRASRRLILSYCSEPNRALHDRLFEALLADHIRFIKKIGDDLYEIRGNKLQIIKAQSFSDHQRDKALKRWEDERAARDKAGESATADTPPNAGGIPGGIAAGMPPAFPGALPPGMPSLVLSSLVLSSPESKAEASGPPPRKRVRKPPSPPSDGAALWEPYRQAHSARYGHDPVRNAPVNSKLKKLAERVGPELAMGVIKFYFDAKDDWLVKRAHPLGTLLAEAETWVTKMRAAAAPPPADPFGGRNLVRELRERGHD